MVCYNFLVVIGYYKRIMIVVMIDIMVLEWTGQQIMGEFVRLKADKVLVVEVVETTALST